MIESVQPDAQHHRSSHPSVPVDGAEDDPDSLMEKAGKLEEGRRAVRSAAHVHGSAGTQIKDPGGAPPTGEMANAGLTN